MARSRSRSGCRQVPVSVYCGSGGCQKRRLRGGACGRKRRPRCGSRRRRRRRSRSSCGRSRRRRSRRRRKSRCGRRKCRGGVKTRNPFLNYLRVFRKKHCKWPQCKIAIEGAKCWCKMSNQERSKFYKQACSMRKKSRSRCRRRKRRRRRGGCGRKRRRRRRRRRCCPM